MEASRVAAGREVAAGRGADRVVARADRAVAREGLADVRVDPGVVSGETAPELQLVNKGGRRRRAAPLFLDTPTAELGGVVCITSSPHPTN